MFIACEISMKRPYFKNLCPKGRTAVGIRHDDIGNHTVALIHRRAQIHDLRSTTSSTVQFCPAPD
jgi:hypothetical protein